MTFTQTVGGRTGAPMPRAVKHAPFIQYRAPIVWTTLQLTIHADGTHEGSMVGASGFPRHWVFDDGGTACRQEQPRRVQAVDVRILRSAHPVG